jgi:large subunit ribosomal protein L31
MKKSHPKWYSDAKVFCDGKLLFTTGSTKPEIYIDVWSGNHPFYTKSQKIIDNEGRVSKFLKKYKLDLTNL